MANKKTKRTREVEIIMGKCPNCRVPMSHEIVVYSCMGDLPPFSHEVGGKACLHNQLDIMTEKWSNCWKMLRYVAFVLTGDEDADVQWAAEKARAIINFYDDEEEDNG